MLLIDLTHTSHTPARTGIQRVARALHQNLSGRAIPVTRDPFVGAWRPLESWELDNLARSQGGHKRRAEWPRIAKWRGRLRRALGRTSRHAISGEHDGLIVPELFAARVARDYPKLFAHVRGPRVALFLDAIPLRFPELTPPGTVARFPTYLQELLMFDGIAAISEESRDSLTAYWRWLGVSNPPPVAAVPLGVDEVKTGPTNQATNSTLAHPVVLSVGTLEGRKNHLTLLEACERLWSGGAAFTLRVIGHVNAETGGAAHAHLRALQAAGRPLLFDGPATDEAIRQAYAECAFTVYPSIAEGFGLPVIESLAHGKPCICSARGALGEISLHGGCVPLPSLEAADIAGAIARLLSDQEELARLSRTAGERRFKSWADYTRELTAWMRTVPPALSRTLPLALVCVLVAVAGTAWQAWDTLGGKGRSLLQGWDDSFYYFWLPSVVIDRDLDFSNQLTQAESVQPNARHDALTMPRTETGFVANKYPPGWALGSLPFFLAAHAIAPRGATGFEPIYQLSVWFGQLLYAALGLWFAIKILERFFAPRIAAGAVFVGWLASPLVYYQSARLSMSHSQVFVLAVAAFWLAFRIADGNARARHWALAGVVAAMLVVTRNIAAVYLVMPAWLAVPKLRSARAIAALLAGAAGPLLVQLVCWRVLYGDWFAYSYGGERFDFAHLHLIEILFSPLHGWFYWHPLLLPAIGAFVLWAVRHTAGRAWLVSLVTMIVLSAAWPTWWLGSSFGFRGLEVATFFAMVGFGWLFSFAATHTYFRRMVAAVVTLGVIWNLALFALFLTQRIPRQEPVTYGDAARAFVTWVRDAR